MRRLRMMLAGTVVTVMVGVLPHGVAAQTDGDDPADATSDSPGDVTVARESREWRRIAESIETLAAEPPGQPEPAVSPGPGPPRQRVELHRAGIALELPSDMTVHEQYNRRRSETAPPLEGQGPPYAWSILWAPGKGSWCDADLYYEKPGSLEEHAAFYERTQVDSPGTDRTASSARVHLPIGEAVRIDIEDRSEGPTFSTYLFDSGEARIELTCSADEHPDDDWMSVARTIEFLGDGRPDEPEPSHGPAIAAWDLVTDIDSVVEVVDTSDADSLEGSLMSADCEYALWLEYEDGSFQEAIACTLSDDPVDPPQFQGTRPAELLTVVGGECGWTSDYWTATDGSEVYASSYEITVTPGGRVFASSTYPVGPLDCPEDG